MIIVLQYYNAAVNAIEFYESMFIAIKFHDLINITKFYLTLYLHLTSNSTILLIITQSF